jgi:hypothetical protein
MDSRSIGFETTCLGTRCIWLRSKACQRERLRSPWRMISAGTGMQRAQDMCTGFACGRGLMAMEWAALCSIGAGNGRSLWVCAFVRLDCPAHIATLCAYYESVGFIQAGLWQEPGAAGYVWSLYEKALYSR